MISSGQVDCLSSDDYSTLRKIQTTDSSKHKSTKSSKISFLNSALQTVRTINRSSNNKSECCKKACKSECKTLTTSVYLEEHKGMDWRLQQLGYQLPEQDERLLADNPHLSNELKFLRTQQKLCSIPVKLYLYTETTSTQTNEQTSANNGSVSKFCNRCEQVINKGAYCVQADLSNLNLVLSTKINKSNKNQQNINSSVQSSQPNAPVHVYFHIDCLQCVTCSEILVDFRAFIDPRTRSDDLVRNGKLSIYCSRHFLELFKPRCELCEELIFDKKCTQAEGRAWHVMHFTCYQCKLPLGGQQYKMADLNQKEHLSSNNGELMRLNDLHKQTKDIHPFCLACCDKLFGEYCARCEKLITCDQNPVKFEKYFWHSTSECFHCDTCGVSLVNSDYLPSSSAKQIFCSTKCAQSLTAKDLNNLSNGLMKLNDKLRTNQHKPTLNSVQEEDDCPNDDDLVAKKLAKTSTKVEYENSSMFHLASNKSVMNGEEKCANDNECNVQCDSPSSNRSLSSLSLLFSSSPDTSDRSVQQVNSSIEAKNSRSIESVCSTESNQLDSSIVRTIAKEIKSTDSEQVSNKRIVSSGDENMRTSVDQQSTDAKRLSADDQKLIPYTIVNNNPFTRTSIIIDNLNSTLSTINILDTEFNASSTVDSEDTGGQVMNSSLSSNARSVQSSAKTNSQNNSPINSSTNSLMNSLNNSLSNSQSTNSSSTGEFIVTTSSSTIGQQAIYSIPSKTESLNNNNSSSTFASKCPLSNVDELSRASSMNRRESFQMMFSTTNQPTHYSTLPTRKSQQKTKVNFNHEEPASSALRPYNAVSNNHFISSATFPVTQSSQSIININAKPVDSMNEIGLPVRMSNVRKMNTNNMMNNEFVNHNLSNFVNCTLPRSNRDRHQSMTDGYLNGAQSMSINKLNATMLQVKYNQYNNSSCNNLSINTSTNSDFSATSSNKHTASSLSNSSNNVILNTNLNSHSVLVSEEQIESLNSQLVVKPLPQITSTATNKQLPRRTPPLPPVDQQHGFIKKWSTTNSISSTGTTVISTQLTELPVIQEHHLPVTSTQSERTSSATPSLGSSIEVQSSDTNEKEERTIVNNNLISMQTFTSSNNSLNTMMQTNLNSSNSASLISATSSISSTMSSTDVQLTRTSLNHDRPDVIVNPIETIKQLKQKQRELKLKEKMLKKTEQKSIDAKPKIIEEKLKTSPQAGKQRILNDEMDRNELLKNNARKVSSDNLQLTKLNNSVSLSSLTVGRTNGNNGELNKEQIKSVNHHLLSTYRSQPNLNCVQLNSSNGETCSNASTPDQLIRLEQLNQMNHLNQLNKLNQLNLNQLPSSQYSPSMNDTDSSSLINSVEMENCVEFNKRLTSSTTGGQLQHIQKQERLPQSSSLKDTESQSNLKQKSVSFDPNVIEKENNKAPKRLNRKMMNGHNYRYASPSSSNSKKKYHHQDSAYELSNRRKRNYQRDHHHHVHYKSGNSRRHNSRRHHDYEEDDFCSTCSSSSCNSSSSYCSSSSDEEQVDHNYLCHGRKNQIKKSHHYHQQSKLSSTAACTKQQDISNLTQLAGNNKTTATSIAPEQMVKIMQQQQLIIQQQLAQMQPQLKQQRYLRNKTNESCVIS